MSWSLLMLYFAEELQIKGRLTKLPRTVWAYLKNGETWLFMISRSSPRVATTPIITILLYALILKG